ncbi:MAG: hypothetical protein ACQESP_02095 [Candidatus Muiribacteriota bacterium]
MDKNIIRKKLFKYPLKTISLRDFQIKFKILDYYNLYSTIKTLEESRILLKIKASKTNGNISKPLYNKYRILKPEVDFSNYFDDIKKLKPVFDIDKYLKKPEKYVKHMVVLNKLSKYLWEKNELLEKKMSKKERSFSIWQQEKFIDNNFSLIKEVLRWNNLNSHFLNYYETFEPFFEYISKFEREMNILIIENKDTWFTFRKLFKEVGKSVVFNKVINGLLYGEGNKITKKGALTEHLFGLKEHKKVEFVNYYYFGDLDFEGIGIYLRILKANPDLDLFLHKKLYLQMLDEATGLNLPVSLSNRNLPDNYKGFYKQFSNEELEVIKNILNSGKYIPQEIINYSILSGIIKGLN